MSTSQRYPHRTRMFARVLGPYLIIVSTVAATRTPDMRALLTEFTSDPMWPWVVGAFILLGGVAIVAFHQSWRGAAAIIVSVLGWLLVARGIFLMAFPDTFASVADRVIGAVGVWQGMFAVLGLIGVYLTYVGWKPEPKAQPDGDVHISIDFPQAV